jgi:two-component system phosphate regulon response regulator PhoB
MITQIILKGQGYETFLAGSIEEAERKIKIHQPGLILLDVCIGDGDGRLFCDKLKSDPDTSSIHVILMSGDECEGNGTQSSDDFLSKPFDFNELVTKVQQQTMEVLAD